MHSLSYHYASYALCEAEYADSSFHIGNCGTCAGLASTIKTHHNDTTLVRKLRDEGRVIEPLKV